MVLYPLQGQVLHELFAIESSCISEPRLCANRLVLPRLVPHSTSRPVPTRAFLPNPSRRHSLIYSLRGLARFIVRGRSDYLCSDSLLSSCFLNVNHLPSIRHGRNQRILIVGKQKMSNNVCYCIDCQYAIWHRYCCCWWTAGHAGFLESLRL